MFANNINILVSNEGGRRQFAEKVGVNYDTVRRWCLGSFLPGGAELKKIAELYPDISIDWLLLGRPGRPQWPVTVEKTEPDWRGTDKTTSYRIDMLFHKRMLLQLGDRSLEWLSDHTRIPLARLQSFTSLESAPTYDELESLAKIFGVSPRWLAEDHELEKRLQDKWEKELEDEQQSFMCGWDEDEIAACKTLKEILDSKDMITIAAIMSNLHAFRESVRRNKRIDKLEDDVRDLKKRRSAGSSVVDPGEIIEKKAM